VILSTYTTGYGKSDITATTTRNVVFLEVVTVGKLAVKVLAFYGISSFIATFTSARH
jgi:hypothetical protein